jgi:uncharacterized protein YceK
LRKVTIIYITVLLLVSGCSGARKASRSAPSRAGDKAGSVSMKDVALQNLTTTGFFIPKAEVELSSDGDKMRFLASVRFDPEGKYLISLRTRSGIEAARIYIDKDTILGNDRINRVLYYGKPAILSRLYGIPFDVLPVVFGDMIGDNVNDVTSRCNGGIFKSEQVIKGRRMSYRVDCGRRKIVSAENEGNLLTSESEIEFDDFIETDGITVPSRIRISHIRSATVITIKVDNIERPWSGSVELIPGGRYKKIELK